MQRNLPHRAGIFGNVLLGQRGKDIPLVDTDGLIADITAIVFIRTVTVSYTHLQNRAGELGVGVQLEAVLDNVLAGAVASLASTDDKAAVRQACMVALQLFLGDKVYGLSLIHI